MRKVPTNCWWRFFNAGLSFAARFTEAFSSSWIGMASLTILSIRVHLNLVIHNPMKIHFSQSNSILVIALAFELVVHQPWISETDTCLQPYNPFHFQRSDTRADANIHKTFAYKYLSNNICTVVEEWTHGFFCLGYFFFSAHFDLVIRLAQKAWRQCALVFCARSWVSWRKLHRYPCEQWPFSFHWWQIPFPPSTPISPFRLLTTAPESSLPCLASKFRNRSFWFILLFTMVFNFWYEESPCRTIPLRFWVAQTRVSSICRDLPRCHRMEFLT